MNLMRSKAREYAIFKVSSYTGLITLEILAPSTLLALVGFDNYSYSATKTIRFENPEFKRLIKDCISELKITICDDTGKIIDNNQQRISLGLEFVKQ